MELNIPRDTTKAVASSMKVLYLQQLLKHAYWQNKHLLDVKS